MPTSSDFLYIVLITFSCMILISGAPVYSSPPPHRMINQISQSWTDERLCVLKMGSSCPSGFTESQIRLSVQTDVNPRDTNRDGEQLIKIGQGGETSLSRNIYDALYTLTITTCCK
ncbi:unnamed protein product [Caenorhabditis nigoni]|uniref:Uncharacterized protein n=1 Tax=Caenorhabditis nigoni TaxID=1611254 RepID=A0A2G5SSF4_9PELO|nr:hypothetical protein B9Z55_024020 [Caenorhabditis nigoni]